MKDQTRKKYLILTLLLIIVISNFGFIYAYWSTTVLGSDTTSTGHVNVGTWNYEDVLLIASQYRSNYQTVLSLSIDDTTLDDQPSIEAALQAYGLLSDEVKSELSDEYTLLTNLFNETIALEHSIVLNFEDTAHDQSFTGTIEIDSRTWYANDVFMSNDSNYDVWMDTRSLAFRSTAYFQSQDAFINGVDKITLYAGALHYGNGTNYQLKIEYELASNSGTWLTLQDNGSDIILDVTSSTPLGYFVVPVNITEAANIRFRPVISTTSDYINLDNIRIYEHVVAGAVEAESFRALYAGILDLTVETVILENQAAVSEALAAYDLLTPEGKSELLAEKTLLDSLYGEIQSQENVYLATIAVSVAEKNLDQSDYDDALLLVNQLPNSTEKTELLNRLSTVSSYLDEIDTYHNVHQAVLNLTVETVDINDKSAIEQAISDYILLSEDVQTKLSLEKSLLDDLLAEINNQTPVETLVQEFLTKHADVLNLTVATVTESDRLSIEQALNDYDLLTDDAKLLLADEKTLFDQLLYQLDINQAINKVLLAEGSLSQNDYDDAVITVEALTNAVDRQTLLDRLASVAADIADINTFMTNQQQVLSMTVETINVTDKQSVEQALASFGILTDRAKSKLSTEETLLLDLLNQIIAIENSVFIDFEDSVHDSLYTGVVTIDSRDWYGNQIAISNSTSYDVWMDERSLGLKSGSYFQSQDAFINGIDKITLYAGALNYNNGASYAFRVEYEFASNPGTWIVVQDQNTDLIIDITSGSPMAYNEIDIQVFESINIRFIPIISNTADYINLDNLTIYEHVVTSSVEVETYTALYSSLFTLTEATVDLTYKDAIIDALNAYHLLSDEAKASLIVEKTLLDNLLVEVNIQEAVFEANRAVNIAELTFDQSDYDEAVLIVNALEDGTVKDDLSTRLNAVHQIIVERSTFIQTYQSVLSLTADTVSVSDKEAIENAIADYLMLSTTTQDLLTDDKVLLDSLLAKVNESVPVETLVSEYLSSHQVALSLTTSIVTINDQSIVELALNDYNLLTYPAKAQLTSEKALLDSLHSYIEVLNAESYVSTAEISLLQVDYDTALVYVNALPASSNKTDLLNRLSAVQSTIDTNKANLVINQIASIPLPGYLTLSDEQAMIDARYAYDQLTLTQKSLVTNINTLSQIENEFSKYQIASQLVVTAEESHIQSDVDTAWLQVNQLTTGPSTTALINRLNAVQDIIDVNQASQIIASYFASNRVSVSRFYSNSLKEIAFLEAANNQVSSLNVDISVNSYHQVDRYNSTYQITITKHNASISMSVSVRFTR